MWDIYAILKKAIKANSAELAQITNLLDDIAVTIDEPWEVAE